MNLSNVEFQLQESAEALQTCLQKIKSGTLSPRNESRLSEHLGRVLDHIALAWNARDLATHEVGHMGTRRVDFHKELVKLYDERSTAAHSAKSIERDAASETFDVISRVLTKILTEKSVPSPESLEESLFAGA